MLVEGGAFPDERSAPPIGRVVLGCDRNPDYAFFLPLTCGLWRWIGYRPLVLLVGSLNDWLMDARSQLAATEAGRVGAECVMLGHFEGHRSSTVAQVARLFAAVLPLPDDTFLMTSDVDLWPLDPAAFALPSPPQVRLVYPRGEGSTCALAYTGMTVERWREVMGLSAGTLAEAVRAELDQGLGRDSEAAAAWNYDQELLSRRLLGWRGHPACERIERRGDPPRDRLDRGAWPAEPRAEGMLDAHLPRPGFGAQWASVRALFGQLLPEWTAWADAYEQRFVEGLRPRPVAAALGRKRLVIVVRSYNNARWCEDNLRSLLEQDDDGYRVIYVDDASTDGTADLVERHLRRTNTARRVTVVRNPVRRGAMANLWQVVRALAPDEIVVRVDGDDALAHRGVISRLRRVYEDPDVWLTYGQFRFRSSGGSGWAEPLPAEAVAANAYRDHAFVSTHLVTFYAGLFQQIRREDLLREGDFYPMADDVAILFPLLEMAGEHSRFLPDVLYVYNDENPLSDHRRDRDLQFRLGLEARGRARYGRSERFDDGTGGRTVYVTPGQWVRLFDVDDPWLNGDGQRRCMVEVRQALNRLGYGVRQADTLSDLRGAACLVAFDVPAQPLDDGVTLPRERRFLFLWEPVTVWPANDDAGRHREFARVYTWRDDLVDGERYRKFQYPVRNPMADDLPPFTARRLCTTIVANKSSPHPLELYSQRHAVIAFFDRLRSEECVFHGRGWDAAHHPAWRGEVSRKLDCLRGYRFALCYENAHGLPGYVTEKIFDAFQAGCVPVYLGAPNVAAHVPRDCFLPREELGSDEEMVERLRAMPEDEHRAYQERIRRFLESPAAAPFGTEALVDTFVEIVRSL